MYLVYNCSCVLFFAFLVMPLCVWWLRMVYAGKGSLPNTRMRGECYFEFQMKKKEARMNRRKVRL